MSWLTRLWVSIKGPFKIKDDLHQTQDMLFSYLTSQFPIANIHITDDTTKLIYTEDMERLKVLNYSRYRRWRRDVHDCDDFAFEFKGIINSLYGNVAIGLVFVHTDSGNHALNCFIDEFGRFNYFEPQTNEIFKRRGGYRPYLIII